jgi:hypothetical protein
VPNMPKVPKVPRDNSKTFQRHPFTAPAADCCYT